MPRFRNVEHARIREALNAVAGYNGPGGLTTALRDAGYDDVVPAVVQMTDVQLDEAMRGGRLPEDLRE